MPRDKPADHVARDHAVHGRDENLWIEAGAGTGKTTLLVERILALLTDTQAPLRLSRLAAITFTEKAAGELKMKIRQEIEQRLAAADNADARAALAAALAELETATIGTLHSFARQLLTERPVEAGIDPQGAVMDENAFGDFLEKTYDAWFDAQVRATPAAAALRWQLTEQEFFERRGDWDWLWKLVQRICRDPDVLLEAPPPPPFDVAAEIAALRAAAAESMAHARANCTNTDDDAFRQTAAFFAAMQSLPDAADRTACRAAIEALPPFNLTKGSDKNWSGQKAVSKTLRADLKARKDRLLQFAHAGETWALFELAREFARHFEDEKRRRSALGFQDLLVRAAQMLQKNEIARRYFQDRFDALLIDEFQDTDPLQVEIAFFLAEDGVAAKEWEAVKLKPGKLVVVGDPKQSIYRFRRADIEVYEQTKRRLLPANAEPTFINVNFRSAAPILETVNAVFAPLMRLDPELPVSPNYVPLVAGRAAAPPDAGAVLLAADQPFASAAAARTAEYAAVAAWIRRAHETALPIWDKEQQRLRPLQWRDVAILDRRASEFAGLEQALRNAEVPHRIEGGKVYFRREEIAAAVNGLLALEDPDDGVALAQWLASELVGFSDNDLLAHVLRRADGRLSFLGDAAAPGDELGEALAALRALHENRNRVGCLATVRGLFDFAGALPTAFTFPRREVAVANLRKLLDAARAADADRRSFGEFAREWAAAFNEAREEADFAITEDADDVVRVMTIHKAKGLDWPVVVVIDLGVAPRAPGYPPVLLRRAPEKRAAVYLGSTAQTAAYPEMLEQEKSFDRAEQVRQLYVAMTRARDYLVLPLFAKKAKPGGFLAFLAEAGMVDAETRIVDSMGARVETVAVDDLDLAAAPRWELPQQFARRALPAKAQRAVDELLARRAAGPPPLPPAPPAVEFRSPSAHDAPLPPAEHSAGPTMGEAFHLAMERIDLAHPAAWETTIAETAARFGLGPADRRRLRDWLDKFSTLPSFALLTGARVWREIPFTWTDPRGAAYSGKIDLLADTRDGLLILDYKTDRFAPDKLPAYLAAYRSQGAVYRDAVKALTGRDDVTMKFCFVEMEFETTLDE